MVCDVWWAQALPYVVPRHNVRIECPISLVDKVGGDCELQHPSDRSQAQNSSALCCCCCCNACSPADVAVTAVHDTHPTPASAIASHFTASILLLPAPSRCQYPTTTPPTVLSLLQLQLLHPTLGVRPDPP